MKTHPLFAEIFFLTISTFYWDYFLVEILKLKPVDSLNSSKASDLAFFCWESFIRCLIYLCIFCNAVSTSYFVSWSNFTFSRFWISSIDSHKIQHLLHILFCITNCSWIFYSFGSESANLEQWDAILLLEWSQSKPSKGWIQIKVKNSNFTTFRMQ